MTPIDSRAAIRLMQSLILYAQHTSSNPSRKADRALESTARDVLAAMLGRKPTKDELITAVYEVPLDSPEPTSP